MRRFIQGVTACLLILASLTLPPIARPETALAADFTVVCGNWTASFSHALNAVQLSGGTIDFNCGPDPVTITIGNATITSNVVIDGGGLITLRGESSTRLFTIEEQASLGLVNIEISGGASDDGGAIYNAGGLNVYSSTFLANSASDDGGAIYNDGGTVVIENSTLSHNSADSDGGAIFTDGGEIGITGSTLSLNTASDDSGAINNSGGEVTITDSTISENTASDDGGAIYNDDGLLIIERVTLKLNTAGDAGGAIYTRLDTVFIIDSDLIENWATGLDTGSAEGDGGSIYNRQGFVGITGSTLDENLADEDGGVILNNEGTVEIIRSTLSLNHAGRDGGAIFTINDGAVWIDNSTLHGNSAGDDGGAIDNGDGLMSIANSTLSGNTSGDNGGAINTWDAELVIINSTLFGNTSTANDGGIWIARGTMEILNSIFAGDGPPNCINDGGTLTSIGYNLSDDDSCGLAAATNDLIVDEVQLQALADNGGPTRTHFPVLDPDNPIFNAIPTDACVTDGEGGDPIPDQRGTSRPQPAGGNCDIGSVEVFNIAPSVSLVTATPNTVDEGSSTTINVTASDPADEDDDSLVYAFDCDGDGTFEIARQSSAEIECSYADDELVGGLATVGVQVTDSAGLTVSGSVNVTVLNVVPSVRLGDDVEINEGDSFSASGSFSDPAAADTHTATVDYGDGLGEQSLALNPDGAFTLDYDYLADDGEYQVQVCVTDDDQGAGCDDLQVTVLNVAPAIMEISALVSGSQASLTVTATDPAGVNDPLTYAFDCNNDGVYEVDAGTTDSASCYLGTAEGAFTIGVQVSDDDGGVTTDTVMVGIPTELCANGYTGVLRYSANCQDHETAITLPDDGPVESCASQHTGILRLPLNGACSDHETSYVLPEDGPLSVCINRYTDLMRVVDDLGQCASAEVGKVIAATEIAGTPGLRAR